MTAATFEQPLRLEQIPSLTYSATTDKFDKTWRGPLSTLLGLGRAVGADFVEFFLERKNYISCLADQHCAQSSFWRWRARIQRQLRLLRQHQRFNL